MTNSLNYKKLIGSKWRKKHPENSEKHFLVKRWLKPSEGEKGMLEIEAILTQRNHWIHFQELNDPFVWAIGWNEKK